MHSIYNPSSNIVITLAMSISAVLWKINTQRVMNEKILFGNNHNVCDFQA